MTRIVPHLWFDDQAREAAEFYVDTFPRSAVTTVSTIRNVPSPSGDSDIVYFTLGDQPFMAISAGPAFTPNPSISFIVNFDPATDDNARKNLDATWERLSDGGAALMPLDTYPFSERYGWIADKYGFTWQLMLTDPAGEPRPFIIPSLLFVGDVAGKAEEATDFYLSVFPESERGSLVHYPPGDAEPEKSVMFTDFRLSETWLSAMDSSLPDHHFTFNEAVSLLVPCETQDEVDRYWAQLSAVPEAEQCGWLKDKFGVSWQIAPTAMDDMLRTGTPEQIDRVTAAFMPMKKMDIETLRAAFDGS
ncbi:MAG: VOC family protein [Mycobacteriaceae bacterium]|nr:VOC family protein [Mycobacteriaceae bacterium]